MIFQIQDNILLLFQASAHARLNGRAEIKVLGNIQSCQRSSEHSFPSVSNTSNQPVELSLLSITSPSLSRLSYSPTDPNV